MSQIHPFYRFSPAWNTGFYPQNVIATNQLNDMYSNILLNIGTWGAIGTSTVTSLNAEIKALVSNNNQFPILGNFTSFLELQYSAPDDFRIVVLDPDLFATDNTQFIEIYGEFVSMSNKTLTSISVTPFTVASYSGTFDPGIVPAEEEIKSTLEIVNDYGSAIFPLIYSYNQTTGIATSYLARASSVQLSSGNIARLPAEVNPKENIRRFELPALTAEHKYIVTFMEQVINASIGQTDQVAITAIYTDFIAPTGWTKNYIYDGTTYDRVQITISSSSDRTFALYGKLDGQWMWQRFVNDIYVSTANHFLTNYSPTTQLPLEPTSGSRYVYMNTWYDYDLCDFVPECFVSPEFYPMPAIPGDQYQFNVIDGNLTGLNQVNVGLFEQDGGFVQKIGQAVIDSYSYELTGFYVSTLETNLSYTQWWTDIYDDQYSFDRGQITFQLVNCDGDLVGSVLGSIAPNTLTSNNPTLFVNAFDAIDWPNFVLAASVQVIGSTVTFNFTLSSDAECNCGIQMIMYSELNEQFLFIDPADITTSHPQLTQHQATVTIPTKQGCYRMGLYSEPEEVPPASNDCEITYTKVIDSNTYEDFLCAIRDAYSSINPYIAFSLNGNTYIYNVPSVETCEDIGDDLVNWANSTIPGMVAVNDVNISVMSFTWTVTIECNSETVFQVCQSDYAGVCLDTEYPFFATQSACCPCEPNCQATFQITGLTGTQAFNPIENDPTGYLAVYLTPDSAQPYENKICLNKLPNASLVGLGFCQKLGDILDWLQTIPEISIGLSGPPCIEEPGGYQLDITWTPYIPCDTNYKFIFGFLTASETYYSSIGSTEQISCPCPPAPEGGSTYSLYSLSNIINIDRADCFSTILEFWSDNDTISEGFEYYNNWKQKVRIGLNGGGEKPVIEENLYRQSNGVHKRPQNKQDLSLDLHTDFIDLDTQLAMTDATRHPYLVWSGKPIFVKGDIEVATTQDFTTQSSFETLSQMKFQALLQGFQPRNSSCLNC